MAEALAALGAAASIAQFAVMGLKGAKFVLQSYKSADGLVKEMKDMQSIVQDIKSNYTSLLAQPTEELDDNLRSILETSKKLAKDLAIELDRIRKVSEKKQHLARARHALRVLWKKSEIEDTQRRLVTMRSEVQFALVVALR